MALWWKLNGPWKGLVFKAEIIGHVVSHLVADERVRVRGGAMGYRIWAAIDLTMRSYAVKWAPFLTSSGPHIYPPCGLSPLGHAARLPRGHIPGRLFLPPYFR